MRKDTRKKYDKTRPKEIFEHREGYKKYISNCKIGRERVSESIQIAEAYEYRNLEDVIKNKGTLKSGDKVCANNMSKGIAPFLIGGEPMAAGCSIPRAHVDSPRPDIRQNPLYENKEFVVLDMHYHGSIKKYQWATLSLALHGIIAKEDGTVIELNIGEDNSDPIAGISDLLAHLSADQMNKKANNVIEDEDLNVTIESMPPDDEEKDTARANILKLLKEKYDFEEDDFVSAETEVIPAGKVGDYGPDRSTMAGYGYDDRVCIYTSMMAQLGTESVKRTAVTLLVDKEETGSIGVTGQYPRFFENIAAEIMNCLGECSGLNVRRALKNSKMLSNDISAVLGPNYVAVNEEKNSVFMGHGLVFDRHTGSRSKGGYNDANAEYMVELRNTMDFENVTFQTAELDKIGQGGGGTIAYILTQYSMKVIDSGITLHNMRVSWEIASETDI